MNLTIRIFMVDYLCQPVDSANILLRGVKSTLANGNKNHIKWDDRQEQQLRSFLCIYVRACVLTANFFLSYHRRPTRPPDLLPPSQTIPICFYAPHMPLLFSFLKLYIYLMTIGRSESPPSFENWHILLFKTSIYYFFKNFSFMSYVVCTTTKLQNSVY